METGELRPDLRGMVGAGKGWRWEPRENRPGGGEVTHAVLGKPKRLGQAKKGLGRTALGKWIEGTEWKRLWWGGRGAAGPRDATGS